MFILWQFKGYNLRVKHNWLFLWVSHKTKDSWHKLPKLIVHLCLFSFISCHADNNGMMVSDKRNFTTIFFLILRYKVHCIQSLKIVSIKFCRNIIFQFPPVEQVCLQSALCWCIHCNGLWKYTKFIKHFKLLLKKSKRTFLTPVRVSYYREIHYIQIIYSREIHYFQIS